MNKKKIISLIILCLSIQGCGKKEASSSSNSSAIVNGQLPIIGGSVTKEIIIRTNNEIKSSSQIIAGNIISNGSNYSLDQSSSIIKKINNAKSEGLKKYKDGQSLIKPEYNIDLGTAAGTAVAAAVFSPPVAVVAGLGLTFGGSALKGFIAEDRQNKYEEMVSTLSDRRDRDILSLAVTIADDLGDNLLKDIYAGVAPEVVKEKILKFKNEIIANSDLSTHDIENFMASANDNVLLGYAMAINDNDIKISKDLKKISSDLKQDNLLLKGIAENTNAFLKKQNELLSEITRRFNPEERELLINTLFDPNVRSTKADLMNPEQLSFFKNHPDKLLTYKRFLKNNDVNDLISIVNIQESAQKSLAYLQVTSQIANNLNLNTDVIVALNTGTSVSSAVSSLASFAVTSNPLDALNALSSITGLFSKPKPDPRFTAIFENFKQINSTLHEIQNQLRDINGRLDNIDDGLSYVIGQNRMISGLILERSMSSGRKCVQIADDLSKLDPGVLTLSYLSQAYGDSRQGDDLKIDACISYLLDIFDGPISQNKLLLNEGLNPENISSDPEVTKYFSTADQLKTIYSSLYPQVSSTLKDVIYRPESLLSVGSVLFHVNQLVNNSFLFDFARVNPKNKKWEIVTRNELTDTINTNKKLQRLLENAIRLIEVSLVEQSVIDGNIENKETLNRFLYNKNFNCSDVKFSEVACLGIINPILMNNMIIKSFRELVGFDFYWSWKQVAENNPDWINEKLSNTSLKIIWVGSGASPLFRGERLGASSEYKDGAYVQVGTSKKLFAIPTPDSVKPDSSLLISERVQTLKEYKKILENELIERNIDKVLNSSELSFYNSEKIKLVLQ